MVSLDAHSYSHVDRDVFRVHDCSDQRLSHHLHQTTRRLTLILPRDPDRTFHRVSPLIRVVNCRPVAAACLVSLSYLPALRAPPALPARLPACLPCRLRSPPRPAVQRTVPHEVARVSTRGADRLQGATLPGSRRMAVVAAPRTPLKILHDRRARKLVQKDFSHGESLRQAFNNASVTEPQLHMLHDVATRHVLVHIFLHFLYTQRRLSFAAYLAFLVFCTLPICSEIFPLFARSMLPDYCPQQLLGIFLVEFCLPIRLLPELLPFLTFARRFDYRGIQVDQQSQLRW